MASQVSFFQKNIISPITDGALCAGGAAIVSKIAPGIIGVNPAISALFVATFVMVDDISRNFLNYCLKTAGYTRQDHQYTYEIANLSSHALGIFTAIKVTAVSITAFQMIALILSSAIVGGMLLGLVRALVPSSNNIAPASNPAPANA